MSELNVKVEHLETQVVTWSKYMTLIRIFYSTIIETPKKKERVYGEKKKEEAY